MAFAVRVNGEEVKRFDEQVTGVHLRTAQGEAAAMGISNVGVVDIVVDFAYEGDQRLDKLEAQQRRERRERLEEGMVTGPPSQESDRSLGVQQDLTSEDDPATPPVHDLTTGLDPNDPDYTEKVSARIEKYDDVQDSEKVLDEDNEDDDSESAEERSDDTTEFSVT